MPEPFFRTMEVVLPLVARAYGLHVTFRGLENIPEDGGALVAVNHTSYVDWYPATLAALRRRRRLRFMLKAEMQNVPGVNFAIKHTKLIPVDRAAGADAYAVAVQQLQQGELIGVHPEATISSSFELMEFKTGAARMASVADVPIIPVIVWGAHRTWTKDHPTKLWRNNIHVLTKIGQPLRVVDGVEQATAELRRTMCEMLEQVQQEYPHPTGAFWVPRRLGGSAPTMAEALELREAKLAEGARKRAARAAGAADSA
ncbi:MAG: lysophospholipid acyltransferase family protein [Mycobacterium sp.]